MAIVEWMDSEVGSVLRVKERWILAAGGDLFVVTSFGGEMDYLHTNPAAVGMGRGEGDLQVARMEASNSDRAAEHRRGIN